MKKIILIMISILLLASFSCVVFLKPVNASNNIAINFSANEVPQIYNGYTYDTPDSGYVYAIVNVTITNNGYDSFDTNPIWFSATADNIKYNYDFETFTVNNWKTVSVLNGGSYSGALVFQIPVGKNIESMSYTGFTGTFQRYNIIWNGQTSTPTDSPTQTPTSTPVTPEFPAIAVLAILLILSLFAVTILAIRKRKIGKR